MKYVEERFPRCIEFGSHDGESIDVACGSNLTIVTTDKLAAERIIKMRNELVDFIYDMAESFDAADTKAFTKFWYNE